MGGLTKQGYFFFFFLFFFRVGVAAAEAVLVVVAVTLGPKLPVICLGLEQFKFSVIECRLSLFLTLCKNRAIICKWKHKWVVPIRYYTTIYTLHNHKVLPLSQKKKKKEKKKGKGWKKETSSAQCTKGQMPQQLVVAKAVLAAITPTPTAAAAFALSLRTANLCLISLTISSINFDSDLTYYVMHSNL